MNGIMSQILWKIAPIVAWIDKIFTVPYSIKKITGSHYYLWRDRIDKGMVFLTNTNGAGSNLINPSEINHSAIYFGKGLRTTINNLIAELSDTDSITDHAQQKIDRLKAALKHDNIQDDICYVIEAVGSGVRAMNLVEFMTTKDVYIQVRPRFTDSEGMHQAANNAVHDLGLPYDFGFTESVTHRYCFELCATAYEALKFDIELKRFPYEFLGLTIHESFLSDTFLDNSKWQVLIDSRKLNL